MNTEEELLRLEQRLERTNQRLDRIIGAHCKFERGVKLITKEKRFDRALKWFELFIRSRSDYKKRFRRAMAELRRGGFAVHQILILRRDFPGWKAKIKSRMCPWFTYMPRVRARARPFGPDITATAVRQRHRPEAVRFHLSAPLPNGSSMRDPIWIVDAHRDGKRCGLTWAIPCLCWEFFSRPWSRTATVCCYKNVTLKALLTVLPAVYDIGSPFTDPR